MKLDIYLTLYKKKNQLKVNQNLNIRAMIAKLLEENTGECFMTSDLVTFS